MTKFVPKNVFFACSPPFYSGRSGIPVGTSMTSESSKTNKKQHEVGIFQILKAKLAGVLYMHKKAAG